MRQVGREPRKEMNHPSLNYTYEARGQSLQR